MSIVKAGNLGWVISHEIFIKHTYRNTNHSNEIKSYSFNSGLFDIKIPFLKSKRNRGNDNINDASDIGIVKNAYDNLFRLYEAVIECSTASEPENNCLAKSLSDNFYCQRTRHPGTKFSGGNLSQEPLVSEIENELYLIPENSLFFCNDVKNLSESLRCKEFDFILMDPPWWNKYIRRKRKKNSKFGYSMIYDKDLINIPVSTLLSVDGIVAVWCTSAPSHIKSVLNELFPAWNIQYVTQWFWLKITKQGKPICDFSQTLKKQPFERIIFGIKKNSIRSLPSPANNKVLMSVPSAIHSHKPPLSELLKPYLPEKPKCLELFARYLLPGWTSYGHEVLKLQHMSLYIEENVKEQS